jgi:hypothetical protein
LQSPKNWRRGKATPIRGYVAFVADIYGKGIRLLRMHALIDSNKVVAIGH